VFQTIPTKVGKTSLLTSQYGSDGLKNLPSQVAHPVPVAIKALGKSTGDFSMGIGFDASYKSDLKIWAFRQMGVSAQDFLAAFKTAATTSYSQAEFTYDVVDGKPVWTYTSDPYALGTWYLIPRDDVLFVVSSLKDNVVQSAIAALP
jgi:hypothetical protein